MDKYIVKEHVIDLQPFRCVVRADAPAYEVVGNMLGEFQRYLASLGTVIVRNPPEIRKEYDYNTDADLLYATFRMGVDTTTPKEDRKVVRADSLTPPIGDFSEAAKRLGVEP